MYHNEAALYVLLSEEIRRECQVLHMQDPPPAMVGPDHASDVRSLDITCDLLDRVSAKFKRHERFGIPESQVDMLVHATQRALAEAIQHRGEALIPSLPKELQIEGERAFWLRRFFGSKLRGLRRSAWEPWGNLITLVRDWARQRQSEIRIRLISGERKAEFADYLRRARTERKETLREIYELQSERRKITQGMLKISAEMRKAVLQAERLRAGRHR